MFAQEVCRTDNVINVELTAGATENIVQSKAAVKQFTYIVLTNILYERSVLPEHLFMDHTYEGIPVKGFNNSNDLGIQAVKRWMSGANDAIDRGYLKQMIVVVENRERPGEPLERYFFKYHYSNEQNPIVMDHSCLKDQIEYFLDVLQTTLKPNLKPLPRQSKLRMAAYLVFNDDVTPKTYRSPFFNTEKHTYLRIPGTEKLGIGRFKTPFHKVAVSTEGFLLESPQASRSSDSSDSEDENIVVNDSFDNAD